MIDELEAKRQHRRDTREGLIRWVKSLRGKILLGTRAGIAATVAMEERDLAPPIQRVLDACTDSDIVDMLALCGGAHQYGELAEHIRSVRFLMTVEDEFVQTFKEYRQGATTVAMKEATPPELAEVADGFAAWLRKKDGP